MDRAIKSWLQEQREAIPLPTDPTALNDLATKLPPSYTIFGRMLLLPPKAFSTPEWQNLLTSTNPPIDLETLYPHITKALKTTHIALNKPIPAQTTSATFTSTNNNPNDPGTDQPNILRSPLNFTPIHGDFGPTTSATPPSKQDFNSAFWTSTKQSGLTQTWAPRWTMFSRGNFGEKARLLRLPSVREAVDRDPDGQGCAAVDLYVGIGYFAFSYLAAGVRLVLGWEINPWSVEGLKRGAEANRWAWVEGRDGLEEREEAWLQGKRMVVFQESNEFAANRIERLRDRLPPVRHVNCGLLPTSRGSWETAVRVLDPGLGGWVHVHENFAVGEIEEKAREVERWFGDFVGDRVVSLEFVHRLKSYAPGVMHCVLDIYIAPLMPG